MYERNCRVIRPFCRCFVGLPAQFLFYPFYTLAGSSECPPRYKEYLSVYSSVSFQIIHASGKSSVEVFHSIFYSPNHSVAGSKFAKSYVEGEM